MAKVSDLTGRRFGTLIAESVNKEESITGAVKWNCICDCGAKVVVRAGNLRSGHTKSHRGCPLRERSYNFDNLTGRRFGRLTVISESDNDKSKIMWLCKCDCGNDKIVAANDLKSGHTKSCGCLSAENRRLPKRTTHQMSRTRLYKEYVSMKTRCKPNYHNHNVYYDKGVSVCEEWAHPNGFNVFRDWALSHGYDDQLTLDRIDNDGNYEPENCRWITMREQQNNRSNNVYIAYLGETHTLKEWSERMDLSYGMLKVRHRKGLEPPELFQPPMR